jgi:phosphotransferase system enzyme I (PtsI)
MAREQRTALRGIAASPGMGVGRAVVISSEHQHVRHHRIEDEDTEYEIERLRVAVERSRRELEDIRHRLGEEAPADYRLILDAHLMMHRDELLIDAATDAITSERLNAEWAVERAVSAIAKHLAEAPVDYFRDRASDVEHVGRRIIAQLAGRSSTLPSGLHDCVLVIEDLHPADAAQLIETPVAALVTGLGSATSHSAILARALQIPAVVGVPGITGRVGGGDLIIVDAFGGEVVLGPEPAECDRALARARRFTLFRRKLRESGLAQASTRDGEAIELMANVDLPSEAAAASEIHAQGIGLYRTEFLFLNRQAPPTEQEQYEIYAEVVRKTLPNTVTLRTIDMGGEALKGGTDGAVPNPALGLRAIRLALANPELLGAQLRAVLRASALGPVKLMFPLVSGLGELRAARAALEQARVCLRERNEACGTPEVGVMIELPSAVMMSDRFAQECDFLSVGTNDLVQYGLAVDRGNPAVAYLSQSHDPAVLRMLALVVASATLHDTPLAMCGDMAADPFVLPLVIGLGYRRLSVPVSALPLVREVLRQIDTREAAAAAEAARECVTAAEVAKLVVERFGRALRELWAEAGVAR